MGSIVSDASACPAVTSARKVKDHYLDLEHSIMKMKAPSATFPQQIQLPLRILLKC